MREGLAREEAAARRTGAAIFRGLFLFGFFGFALLPWSGRVASRDGAMSLVIGVTMFVTWVAEQLFPARPEWNVRPLSDGREGWARLARDLVYLLGVTRGTALLLGAVDPFLHRLVAKVGLALWPTHAPLAVRIALAFFAVELFSYWVHRAAHHSRLLWQFHSTHHVITELNAFKSVRTHPLDNLVFHLCRLTPLLLIGAGADELAAAVYLGALAGILAHANLELGTGPLGWVVNLPHWHAVHHSSNLEESRSNYGCHTVLWDRIFGTFRALTETSAPVGVEPVGPRSLWQELAWPLYRWVSIAEASGTDDRS